MERKLRHSRQRERIYEYLCSSSQHPTAETVYTHLKEEMPELSLGTVYRNLKLLEELGKIRRVAANQGMERYDAICGDHAHFLCTRCGSLRDLESPETEAICKALLTDAGYKIEKLDITLSGICPNCAE